MSENGKPVSIECAIARDLMPLAIEQVCSEDSARLVTEHVKTCPDCEKAYRDMQSATPAPVRDAQGEPFKNALRRLRRTVAWRVIKLIALCVLALTVLTWGAGAAYNRLWHHQSEDMPLEAYDVTLQRTTQGRIWMQCVPDDSTLICEPRVDYSYSLDSDGAVMYISMLTSVFALHNTIDIRQPNSGDMLLLSDGVLYDLRYIRVPWEMHNARMPVYSVFDLIDDIPLDVERAIGGVYEVYGLGQVTVVSEIRKGTPENYEVLYRMGDELPLCSNALERYLYQDALEASAPAQDDGAR